MIVSNCDHLVRPHSLCCRLVMMPVYMTQAGSSVRGAEMRLTALCCVDIVWQG